jgi:hypothetical protein
VGVSAAAMAASAAAARGADSQPALEAVAADSSEVSADAISAERSVATADLAAGAIADSVRAGDSIILVLDIRTHQDLPGPATTIPIGTRTTTPTILPHSTLHPATTQPQQVA